jgi:catechol 2,3-dioxygenase-like lactoylglutathione lyase family enzyme
MIRRARAIDHLVLGVRDLDAAAASYERLGFTVTPRGVHPWGTWNRLVQLADQSFLELLAVGEAEKIAEHREGFFSFGAFMRDRIAEGEGLAMLVLTSDGAHYDHAAFEAAGLPTFSPFAFGRVARSPDGSERRVAFDLTFTASEAVPKVGFFTCHHRHPENFWREELQRHANGATGLAGVTLATSKPAEAGAFLRAFACGSGGEAGVVLDGASVELVEPALPQEDGRLVGLTLRVADLEACAAHLSRAGVSFSRRERLRVPDLAGVALDFVAQSR